MSLRVLAWIVAILLSGCAALPSQVSNPPGGAAIPAIKSVSDATNNAKAFADTWRKAKTELLLERDVLNNSQFALAVAGAYHTARRALTPAKWSLAGAGGVGLVLDRYQVEAQALAYGQGAAAMECLGARVSEVPNTFWSKFDPTTGEFTMDLKDIPAGEGDDLAQAYETLQGSLIAVQNELTDVSAKVNSNVSSKALKVPDAGDIKKAVQDEQNAAQKSDEQAKKLAGGPVPQSDLDAMSALDRFDADLTAQVASLAESFQTLAARNPAAARNAQAEFARATLTRNQPPTLRATPSAAQLEMEDLLRQRGETEALIRNIRAQKSRLAASNIRLLVSRTTIKGVPEPSKQAIKLALQLPKAMKACSAGL
jgi:hypothetical protein